VTDYSPVQLEEFVRQRAPEITQGIQDAAARARNEADLVAEVEDVLKRFKESFGLTLDLSRERILVNGRADALYNRFVIEYEPPGSLRKDSDWRKNQHAIGQVKQYIEEMAKVDRQRQERLAGVALDGSFYIFVRYRDGHWRVDDPIPVNTASTQTFLRYLLSLSTELPLTPENLVRGFGENSEAAILAVPALYKALRETDNPKAQVLFAQ